MQKVIEPSFDPQKKTAEELAKKITKEMRN